MCHSTIYILACFITERARNADAVLECWDLIPGEGEDGSIDFNILREWINSAIDECRKLDREKNGYYKIGQILGQLRDESADWPTPGICELIEEINNESCNDGIFNGVVNGRGPKVKIKPADSGTRERAIAKTYQNIADQLGPMYPFVSAIMQRVANFYNTYAKDIEIREAQSQLE